MRWTAPKTTGSLAKPIKPSAKPKRRSVDYAHIANHLASASAILQAIRSSHAQPQSTESMTETEEQLARIWADLLERPLVSVTDNFFDLGGHSLLAVLLLLRIRESFGVELSIDDVYSGTLTLSDLAASIETAQLGGIDPEDYAALLAEIEGLSDEEARQLLAAEDSANADALLLTSNASYDPPRGGSTRSNLIWLSHLARAGHSCRVVCAGLDARTVDPAGIEIVSVDQLSRRTSVLSGHIRDFQPDWVLVSSEDLSHVLLREAHHTAASRLVYLAHTPQWYPFGPASWHPDAQAAAIVRNAAGVVAISHAMAAYIQEHRGDGRCHSSADVRQSALSALRLVRGRLCTDGESMRGEGDLDLSCLSRAVP